MWERKPGKNKEPGLLRETTGIIIITLCCGSPESPKLALHPCPPPKGLRPPSCRVTSLLICFTC